MHFESQGVPSALPELMRLEALRMQTGCEKIRPDVFRREKEVVLNELRQRLGAEGGNLRAQLNEVLYPPGHPYRVAASVQSVSGLTQADVCYFIADPMRRGRATVVVSGNLETSDVRNLVDTTFAQVPSRGIDENAKPWTIPPEAAEATVYGDVGEGSVLFAWALPPEGTQEYRFLQLLRGSLRSALGRRAVQGGWGHGARTWTAGGGDAPYLILQVSLRSMKHVDVAKKAMREVAQWPMGRPRKLKPGTKDEGWAHRVVSLETKLLLKYESLAGRAEMFSDNLLYSPEVVSLVAELKELRTSTRNLVRGLGRTWLHPRYAKVIAIEPKEGATSRSVESAYTGGHTAGRSEPIDSSLAHRSIKLPAGGAGLALNTTRFTLKNGLNVVLWEHGEVPVVHSVLVNHTGSASDPRGREGTALLSGFDSVLEDSMMSWGNHVSTMLDRLLESSLANIRRPSYFVSKRLRKHLVSRLALSDSQASRDFDQDMREALFGEKHPYARPVLTAKSIKNLTSWGLRSWTRRYSVPKNSTLILTGRFDPAFARKWIEYEAWQSDGGARAKPVDATPQPVGGSYIVGESSDASPTVDIDIRFLGSAGVDESHATRQVLSAILSSKLVTMREEHAISYGISANYIAQDAGGYWHISGAVDAGRAREAGLILRKTLEDLRSGQSSWLSAFVLARRKRVNSLLAGASDSAMIAQQLSFIARFGLEDDFYEALINRIAAMQPAAIEALIASELGAKDQITGAFGQAGPVKQFLDAMKGK